jgi:hypothetical protein
MAPLNLGEAKLRPNKEKKRGVVVEVWIELT